MSHVEDRLRSLETLRVPDPEPVALLRRRARRRRLWRSGFKAIPAVALLAIAVGAALGFTGDDEVEVMTGGVQREGTHTTSEDQAGSAAQDDGDQGDPGPAATAPGARPIPEITGAPDQIVAQTEDGAVAVIDVQSGEQVATLDDLIEFEGATATPYAVGPDGSLWYWLHHEDRSRAGVWRLGPDGAAELVVAGGGFPALSADGTRLAYSTRSDPDGERPEYDALVVRDLATGQERRWTGLPDDTVRSPTIGSLAWAPDGERIAVGYSHGFELEEHEVRVLDLGTDQSLADARPLSGELESPVWTADGVLLVVSQSGEQRQLLRFDDIATTPQLDERFGDLAIHKLGIDGSGQHLVAHGPRFEIYVLASFGEPRLVAEGVYVAAW